MNIASILTDLGVISVGSQKNEEQHCLCPFHNDKSASFSINMETGLWICFAGCGRGNILQLYAKCKGIPYSACIDILKNKYDITFSSLSKLKKLPSYEDLLNGQILNTYPNYIISTLSKELPERARNYLEERLGDYKDVSDYVFYDSSLDMIVFPIMTQNTLKGIIGRVFYESDKRYNIYEGSYLKESIFLYDDWKGRKPVLITEGIFDALKAKKLFSDRCEPIAILGSYLSKIKLELICKKWDRILLALDNDKTGIEATKNIGKLFKSFGKQVYYLKYSGYKDIGEFPLDEEIPIFIKNFK